MQDEQSVRGMNMFVLMQICHGNLVIRNTRNEDIKNWINISNSFISIFAAKLLPFLNKHRVDIKEFARFFVTQIDDETEKSRLQTDFEKWSNQQK